MMKRTTHGRNLLYGLALAALLMPFSFAHHGWDSYADNETVVTGEVQEFIEANPHSELKLLVEGGQRLVELGPPWRNRRAGLTRELLAPGVKLTVHGRTSEGAEPTKLKALRVTIQGRNYHLYPGNTF